jgi:hypothetical protein
MAWRMRRWPSHLVSTSTVQRALRRRGLLLPQGFRADRKSWAQPRKRVFRGPPPSPLTPVYASQGADVSGRV